MCVRRGKEVEGQGVLGWKCKTYFLKSVFNSNGSLSSKTT